ncbi:MAG: ABC transporter substrate-binding protein [Pseudomonadota bacterium]
MKSKRIWLTVCCVLTLSLVFASSLPAATEKPKYGGEVITVLNIADRGFDEAFVVPWQAYGVQPTHEELVTGDWTKGPAGTGEADWRTAGTGDLYWHISTGLLAEKWEFRDPQTVIFYLRKGIKFHNKPPVNGRELTAEDVKFTLERLRDSKTAYIGKNYIRGWLDRVEVPDKYTVILHGLPVDKQKVKTALAMTGIGDIMSIVPREALEAYGGNMKDWRAVIGTGPFMLEEYVPQSSITYVRNPDYWRDDPQRPGNRLPYIDRMKILIIQDSSTRLAAVRTSKVDFIDDVRWEDAATLKKTAPNLKSDRSLYRVVYNLYGRTDTKPFDDIRVRRALQMSLDHQMLAKKYYGGEAEILTFPVAPLPAYMGAYTPLDKLPPSSRDLYTYNPEKAKKLLAEAGYPKGFKTSIVCPSGPEYVDILSLVKAYWEKIGVDLELQPKEYGVWHSIVTAGKHTQMAFRYKGLLLPHKLLTFLPWSTQNLARVNDQKVLDAVDQMWSFENIQNWDKRDEILREINKYIIDKAWVISLPTPYIYSFWTPWIKNYKGELSVGCYEGYGWPQYVWVDQDLKKKMTGK